MQNTSELKELYYDIAHSDMARHIAKLANELDEETAKALQVDPKEEQKIWNEIARLMDQSNLGVKL